MQAWRIETPGESEVLELVERPDPVPGCGQLVVHVRAVGVNRADILQRRGGYPAPPGVVADVPGLEYVGEVAALGPGCVLRQQGDIVMGLVGGGAYAERLVVHERETIRVPTGLDAHRAAAIPEAFLTAWRAVCLEGGLARGDLCVVHGATSGIGTAAIQIIRAFGARSLGTSRSAERLNQLHAHGMDQGWRDDGSGGLAAAVRATNGDCDADVVLDLLGGDGLNNVFKALRAEGVFVLVGLMAGRRADVDLGRLLMRRLTVRPMTMRSLPLERRIEFARRFEREWVPRFESGELAPVLDRVVPFSNAPVAHRLMESGEHLGKIVLGFD